MKDLFFSQEKYETVHVTMMNMVLFPRNSFWGRPIKFIYTQYANLSLKIRDVGSENRNHN